MSVELTSGAARAQEGRITLDYVHPEGPVVTHMRGIMIANALANMKEVGCYEQYVQLLPEAYHESVLYGVASSWLPIDVVLAHYEACDQLALQERRLQELGALMAERVARTWFAAALRKSRQLGVEGFAYVTSKVDIIASRMYRGGAGTVLQTGPKDIVYEVSGYPHAASRYFRSSYAAYCRASAAMFCKAVFVKPVRARVPHPHTVAIAFSWV